MRKKYFLIFLIPLFSCKSQETKEELKENEIIDESIVSNEDSLKIQQFYELNIRNELTSKSLGSVSKGELVNGKIMPFYGANFTYFDKDSYLGSRAFTSDKVKSIILDTYTDLEEVFPEKHFYLMELSNKEGGQIYPHRTHQNGLSVDFMMPKIKSGKIYTGLDTLGKDHYWLDFNENGEYVKDTAVKIDFNTIAKHILLLNENAKKYNCKISKVIIKIEYKDELFSTELGQKLKESGIYFAKNLTPLINNIHDDHYHVDFEEL